MDGRTEGRKEGRGKKGRGRKEGKEGQKQGGEGKQRRKEEKGGKEGKERRKEEEGGGGRTNGWIDGRKEGRKENLKPPASFATFQPPFFLHRPYSPPLLLSPCSL